MSVRIKPLERPFEEDVEDQLRSMTPPNVEPIALFRVFARNLKMARAMQAWGRYELGRAFSVGIRHREIVIDRTCARCECEYEWGFMSLSSPHRPPLLLPKWPRSPRAIR